MRLRHFVVVVVVAGCSKNPGANADAPSEDAGTGDDVGSSEDAGISDATSTSDGPSVDAPAPPPVCTETKIDIPNSQGSRANAIDGAGNIAGTYVLANGDRHAFRWHASTGFVDLGTLGGGFATAVGISGELTVGNSTVAGDDSRAFISDASGMHELAMPAGARDGHAFGVNASGIAVGDARLPDGSIHALKYQNGMAIDLGTLGERRNSTALAISDSGVIVGSAYDGPTNQTAVMWVNGGITSLGPGTATAVNAAGDIAVGGLAVYQGGTTTQLALPVEPGLCSGSLTGVNDAGWIVGFIHCQSIESSGYDDPTIYVDGVAWDMTQLISVPRISSWASAINNAGQIAANAGSRFASVGAALLITCTRP